METAVKSNGITEGIIWKQLLKFFFPIMLGTLFQQLYSTADAIIVGRFVGTEALAAVGTTTVFTNLLLGFFIGLSSGAGVVIAHEYGARNARKIEQGVHTAMAIAIIGGILVTVFGLLFAPAALNLMSTPNEIHATALQYLRLYIVGMLPALIYNMGTAIFRAVGDSKHPLYFLIVASFANIALDFLFILGFHMGVQGAAIATVLAQVVSAVMVVVFLCRQKDQVYCLVIRKIRITGIMLKRMLQIGLPAAVQSMLFNISNVMIQTAVNGFGTVTIAAWTSYEKLDCLYWMLVNSIGISVTNVVGQNYGAGKIKRIYETARSGLWMIITLTLGMMAVLLLFGRPLLGMFTGDAAVVDVGMEMIQFLVPCYLTYVTIEILSSTIRGTGQAVVPTIITLGGVCVVRILWLLIMLPQFHVLKTVLTSYPLSWSIASVIFIIYFFKGHWLKQQFAEHSADN